MTEDEDVPAQRLMPRNVPTLTEVVSPTGSLLEPGAPTADAPPPGPSAPVSVSPPTVAQATRGVPSADELLARLGPDLDRLISEAIGRVLHEQMLGLNARVKKAVAEVVHEAVANAVTHEAHRVDVRENP